jgi:hypothetical protein
MIKQIISILFLGLLSSPIFACTCMSQLLLDNFAHSDFVAKVRVNKVVIDKQNLYTGTLDITVLDLFKGVAEKQLKVEGIETSCNVDVQENTTWLIFASRTKTGELSFGLCSDPVQIDGKSYMQEKYPDTQEKIRKEAEFKMGILAYLRDHKIDVEDTNKSIYTFNSKLRGLRGFELKEKQYALYKIHIDTGRTVTKAYAVKGFQDKILSQGVINLLKGLTMSKIFNRKDPSKEMDLVIAVYAHPAEKEYKSFLSVMNL